MDPRVQWDVFSSWIAIILLLAGFWFMVLFSY